MTRRLLILSLLPISLASTAYGADHYLRATSANDATYGCANNGDGTTWACASSPGGTGALTTMPATTSWVRGDTYYFARGVYPQITVSTAVSGTDTISLLKATTSAHGSETGWEAALGAGQAEFLYQFGPTVPYAIKIDTSYVIFDGVVGSGSDSSTYGFKARFADDCWGYSPATSLQAFTPTTGTTSGTLTGISTTGSGSTLKTTFTDSGQSWTTNNLSGRYIGVTTGGTTTWYQIDYNANTETSVTTCGAHDGSIIHSVGDSYILRSLPGSTSHAMFLGGSIGANLYGLGVAHTSFDNSACGYDYRTMDYEGIYSTAGPSYWVYGAKIHHNYFSDTNTNLQISRHDGVEVYNNYFANNFTGQGNELHGQQVSAVGPNHVYYNNVFKNSTIYGIGNHEYGATPNTCPNGKVYNNIFIQDGDYHDSATLGLVGVTSTQPDNMRNWEVHHNTIVGGNLGSGGFVNTTTLSSADYKSTVYNNLFYDVVNPFLDSAETTHDYNAFISCSGTITAEDHDVTGALDPFTDSGNGDYSLVLGSAPIDAGVVLLTPFNTDILGVDRPQGSAPDIGAYEYVTGGLVNGACGTSDGIMVAEAPATNLCTTGTESAVTGSKTAGFAWTCGGSGGGTSDACLTAVWYRFPGTRASGVRWQ